VNRKESPPFHAEGERLNALWAVGNNAILSLEKKGVVLYGRRKLRVKKEEGYLRERLPTKKTPSQAVR